MVESRCHKAIEFVVDNLLKCLDENWGIIIFVGNYNEKYVEQIKVRLNSYRIKIINFLSDKYGYDLPREINDITYSKVMSSQDIYNYIPTETFLVFQSDSMINYKNKHYINEYLNYDYVGAPWKKNNIFGFSQFGFLHPLAGQVGNGGFSLRKKSKMLDILKSVSYDDNMNEDQYFSLTFKKDFNEINLKKPKYKLAKRFSVETEFSKDFFAVHRPWSWLNKKELEIMQQKCHGLKTLISLQ